MVGHGIRQRMYAPTYLKENAQPSLRTVIDILKQLLDALAYAHDENVIHRDLKPANLMIDMTRGVQLRILDFGIAIIDNFDHEGKITAQDAGVLGTLIYMAPEQIESLRLSTACDLYAVGIMAWEMLMGRPLFEESIQAIFERFKHPEGFPLEDVSASVPDALSSFVQACTRVDPVTRPTAREGIAVLASLP